MPTSATSAARWLPLREAAVILGESPVTLRRRCASNARSADGIQEARFDGLVARRLGGSWRIWLASGWPIRSRRRVKTLCYRRLTEVLVVAGEALHDGTISSAPRSAALVH